MKDTSLTLLIKEMDKRIAELTEVRHSQSILHTESKSKIDGRIEELKKQREHALTLLPQDREDLESMAEQPFYKEGRTKILSTRAKSSQLFNNHFNQYKDEK